MTQNETTYYQPFYLSVNGTCWLSAFKPLATAALALEAARLWRRWLELSERAVPDQWVVAVADPERDRSRCMITVDDLEQKTHSVVFRRSAHEL